jgi:hypothetical protein
VQASARVWLDTVANVRIHGETQRRPIDLFAEERQHLRGPNPHPYDLARTIAAVASSQFRITLDSNHYSVPSRYAHRPVTVKAHPDRVCVYCDNELIARHPRRWPHDSRRRYLPWSTIDRMYDTAFSMSAGSVQVRKRHIPAVYRLDHGWADRALIDVPTRHRCR